MKWFLIWFNSWQWWLCYSSKTKFLQTPSGFKLLFFFIPSLLLRDTCQTHGWHWVLSCNTLGRAPWRSFFLWDWKSLAVSLWQHLFARLYLAKRLMVDALYFLSTSKAHGPKQDASFLHLNMSELKKSLFQGSWSRLEIDVTSILYCSALQERPCFLRCWSSFCCPTLKGFVK